MFSPSGPSSFSIRHSCRSPNLTQYGQLQVIVHMKSTKQLLKQGSCQGGIKLKLCVGFGVAMSCSSNNSVETVTHMLLVCPSLSFIRSRLESYFWNRALENPTLIQIVRNFILNSDIDFKTQFLLDCSVLPEVVLLNQEVGFSAIKDLFQMTRTWCHSIHRERLRLLGIWNQN